MEIREQTEKDGNVAAAEKRKKSKQNPFSKS